MESGNRVTVSVEGTRDRRSKSHTPIAGFDRAGGWVAMECAWQLEEGVAKGKNFPQQFPAHGPADTLLSAQGD